MEENQFIKMISKIKNFIKEDQKFLFLHASSVNVNGKAILFLGATGSGKSTISSLLSKNFPIIADDTILAIKNEHGYWFVFDGRNKNNLELLKNRSINYIKKFPIMSFLCINRSSINTITPISQSLTCKNLISSIFEIDIQKNQKILGERKKWFSLASDMAKKHEGYYLTFKKDTSINNLIDEKFRGK